MLPYDLIEEYAGKNRYAVIPVENNKSLVVFLKSYTPYIDSGILIDAYYPRSNLTYHETNIIIDKLNSQSFCSTRRHNYFLKPFVVAGGLAGGGFLNTLTYNIEYGSFFNIGSILIDGVYEKRVLEKTPSCTKCGNCIAACPTGAISEDGYNRSRCLRELMTNGMVENDEAAAQFGNRLFGCDICQRVCPANNYVSSAMPDNLNEAIGALFFEDLVPVSKIIGSNYAQPNLINLAVLTAGNLGLYQYCDNIKKLSNNPTYRVNSLRALRQLEDK